MEMVNINLFRPIHWKQTGWYPVIIKILIKHKVAAVWLRKTNVSLLLGKNNCLLYYFPDKFESRKPLMLRPKV